MASVRVNYSNGETYKFENLNPSTGAPWRTYNYGEIRFDPADQPISAVKAVNSAGVDSIRFYDSADNIISQWNPKNRGHGKRYDIAENEEVIVVYGHQNSGKVF